MKTIMLVIASLLFMSNQALAAPVSFSGSRPLVGEITWSPGVGVDSWTASRIDSAWKEWETISGGAVHPIRISSGTPRVVFHCSDEFPIGALDGTDITVGDDIHQNLRHVNLSVQICDDPSRIIMLHAVGHALGWDNDLSSSAGVMSASSIWGFGPAGDHGFSPSDVSNFSEWYSRMDR